MKQRIVVVSTVAGAVVLAAGAIGVYPTPPPASAAPGDEAVIDFPVSFSVRNTNSSKIACPSDGESYRVRGHLTGPADQLSDEGPGALTVTLFIYGFDEGEWVYRFTRVPAYNMAHGMAERGHISVTIDMPGYGSSEKPNGYLVCFGSQADMAH